MLAKNCQIVWTHQSGGIQWQPIRHWISFSGSDVGIFFLLLLPLSFLLLLFFYLVQIRLRTAQIYLQIRIVYSFSYQIDIVATFFKMPEKLYVTYNQVRLSKNLYSIRYPNKYICRYTSCVKNPPTRSSSKSILILWSQSAVVVMFLLESSGTLAWHLNHTGVITDTYRSFE